MFVKTVYHKIVSLVEFNVFASFILYRCLVLLIPYFEDEVWIHLSDSAGDMGDVGVEDIDLELANIGLNFPREIRDSVTFSTTHFIWFINFNGI